MFVRYFVDLGLPFEAVERAFLDDPERWLPGMAHDADERGDRLLGEVGFGQAPRVGKRVEVEVGAPAMLRGTTLLPISWKATTADAVFPSLEADLEIAALGPDRTQLSISARYRPPMGGLGRVLDRALLHRVAEATLKDFLDRVGETLSARVLAASGG